MKTKRRLVIALAALLLAGCKQARLVTERRTIETDSMAVWLLRDSLQLQERQIVLLRSDLKRLGEENVNLRSEGLQYEIRYDTAAPIDSLTGKPPVMSERITAHNSRQEKRVAIMEEQQREGSLQRESLLRANSSLQGSVEEMTRLNRELKEQTVSPTPFNFKLLIAGILSGFFIAILLMLWLLLSRK